jgi:hypothetical protein
MKRRTTILSTASVFFIVLTLLVSCGIATIFMFGDGTILDDMGINGHEVGLTFSVDNAIGNLSDIDPGTGPSLMLFYTITGSRDPVSFTDEFDSTYKRIYNGININSTLNEVLTVDDITLYRFSDDQKTAFQAPLYIATANSRISPDFNCTLTKTAVSGSTVSMDLAFDVGSYTIHNSPKLYRYNGKPFETDINVVDESFEDYHIDDQSSDMFLHIYGAVNVSKGSFNNIYWTDLVHLGYITL